MKTLVSAVVVAVLCFVGYTQVGDSNETQRALFIGNSYTHTNDLPGMVANVLGDNGINLEVESITPGGRTLTQHASDATVRSTILNGDFDFVILQEQSQRPAMPQLLSDQSIPAARTLGAMAIDSGAAVILFETWGHRSGSPNTGHTSFDAMQTALTSGYWSLAEAAGGTISPVGSTWGRALSTTSVVLHSADGSHPSPAGTHLASLVMARTMLGEPLTSFPDNGIPSTEADQLAGLLW